MRSRTLTWTPAILALVPILAAAQEGAVGKWSPAGALSAGRYAPGAALLQDGRVVVAGGYSFETNRTHASSDLFDPQTGRWSEGPAMRFDRNFPLVLPLTDGAALFVAGYRNRVGTTATTERLEADGSRFRPGPPALEERELFAITPLKDGRSLITGGFSTLRRRTLETAEIYDPKADTFTQTGRMTHARFGHTGVLLPDGRVLILGGKLLKTDESVLSAELYDPASGTFTPTGALRVGRDRVTAWLLPDGKRVLAAGGATKEGGTVPVRRSEVYEIAAGRFTDGPDLLRDRMAHAAAPLPDGRVLLTGGWSASERGATRLAELWDPKANSGRGAFRPAGTAEHGRLDHVAVTLRDGRVLVAGGKEVPARDGIESPLTAEIWAPE